MASPAMGRNQTFGTLGPGQNKPASMRKMLALALGTILVAVPARVVAGPGPGQTGAAGLFLNILPAGQGQSTTTADLLQFEATGQPPPHDTDQLAMYENLPVASSITDS